MKIIRFLVALTMTAAAAANAQTVDRQRIAEVLRSNPDILVDAIKSNAPAILAALNKAAAEEQSRLQQEAEKAEKKAFEDAFANPLRPAIDDVRRIRGSATAKYVLVAYSDFECPYCQAAYETVEELRKRYGSDLQFVFKHVPLPFHEHALAAAKWFEAIAAESPDAAWKFHDLLFQNQEKLSVDFFRQTAADLGLDVAKCEERTSRPEIQKRIEADVAEAQRFGFTGTPGFLLNGVAVKGAYPPDHFVEIIHRLEAKQ
jgi:protein-disulfide isomerase